MRRFVFLFLLFVVACAPVPDGKPAPEPSNQFLKDPLYCNTDADCTCGGVDEQTGECFIGNKLYASKFVDFSQSCPDFCSGIAGNLQTACVSNKCQSVPGEPQDGEEPVFCTMDAKQCPDGSFVSRVPPDCEFAPCPGEQETKEPAEQEFNPALAHWQCEDGSWVQRPEQCFVNYCEMDADCQLIGVKNMCGPYKIAAPKTMHKPPVFYENRCGAERCVEVTAACADPSELHEFVTKAACVNAHCVTLPEKQECETDADCAFNSACHPTACVPKSQAPPSAGVMCTEECRPGSLDCGGSCACVDGYCKGQNYWG